MIFVIRYDGEKNVDYSANTRLGMNVYRGRRISFGLSRLETEATKEGTCWIVVRFSNKQMLKSTPENFSFIWCQTCLVWDHPGGKN